MSDNPRMAAGNVTQTGQIEHLLAKRYLGQDEYPRDAPDAQRVIISLEPEHVTTMGA